MTKTWTKQSVAELFELPMMDLLYRAHSIHRQHFNPNQMQLSTLVSIKTGACPEDCKYCPQSGLYETGIKKEKLLPLEWVIKQAEVAKANGATRFCMGAGWRSPPKKDLPKVCDMVKVVKAMDLETCVTLGMLDDEDVIQLKEAGLDYYNHNLDTSPEYYPEVISSRTYQDRLETLARVHQAEINVCCGGILGMGESQEDRISFLLQLNQLAEPPQSIPINKLARAPGTPFEHLDELEDFDLLKTIAVARIMFPQSHVRLTAGRITLNEAMQTLCFFAGANSIFFGESGKLFVTDNPQKNEDNDLLKRLGMTVEAYSAN